MSGDFNEKVKIEIYLPEENIKPLVEKLTEIGACRVGEYDHISSYSKVYGYWRPLNDSNPHNGQKNTINFGNECKLEIICPLQIAREAVNVIRNNHPYELPIINVIKLVDL